MSIEETSIQDRLRARIIVEAREWIGTRYEKQGSAKGMGAGCEHFIAEVMRACGFGDSSDLLPLLDDELEFVSDNVSDAQPGDVLVLCDEFLKEPDAPRHVGFITGFRRGRPYMIHADAGGIVEHGLDGRWQRRAHSLWRLRLLGEGAAFAKLSLQKRAEFRSALMGGAVSDPFSGAFITSLLVSAATSAVSSPLACALARKEETNACR